MASYLHGDGIQPPILEFRVDLHRQAFTDSFFPYSFAVTSTASTDIIISDL